MVGEATRSHLRRRVPRANGFGGNPLVRSTPGAHSRQGKTLLVRGSRVWPSTLCWHIVGDPLRDVGLKAPGPQDTIRAHPAPCGKSLRFFNIGVTSTRCGPLREAS